MVAVTHTLETPAVDLVYDVITPEPGAAAEPARPALLMAGHPMEASGFASLASHFGDRIVVTYDPRGLGRSVRKDGRGDRGSELHVADLHALITELGAPVDVFASSGGAVNLLALVAAHPDDVHTLVAHEPPLLTLLPDAAAAVAAERGVQQTYRDRGWGAGMAAFVGLTSWPGEFDDAYFAQPAPDPAAFGMPTEDDGSRDDPLLSGTANGITRYRPSAEAIADQSGAGVGRRDRRHSDRADDAGDRGAARHPGDPVPQPPWWLPRGRGWLCGPAGGLRGPVARGARQEVLVARAPHPRPARAVGEARSRPAWLGGTMTSAVHSRMPSSGSSRCARSLS